MGTKQYETSPVAYLTATRAVKKLLENYSEIDLKKYELDLYEFFRTYDDGDRSNIWRTNIALWIIRGLGNWCWRREEMQKTTTRSAKWFELMYGDEWEEKYKATCNKLKKNLPSTIDYWTNRGFTEVEAREKIIESQTTKAKKSADIYRGTGLISCRTIEYWTSRGFSTQEALAEISRVQTRDLNFFTKKYGDEIGRARYRQSIETRNKTWETKDRVEHSLLAMPRSNNPNGQEMRAINGFLLANNIDETQCMFGARNKQFFQYIPEVGIRWYDLAVFNNEQHKPDNLKYILEYHGYGHTNFSEYTTDMKHVMHRYNNSNMTNCSTIGEIYNNDMVKRNHILTNYPHVKYIVMWPTDLKNKRFKIEQLLR